MKDKKDGKDDFVSYMAFEEYIKCKEEEDKSKFAHFLDFCYFICIIGIITAPIVHGLIVHGIL